MLLAAEAQEDTTMMLVTHLAPAILEATGRKDLRVDGIEATGLDADLELMVDRTPKRNHLARSTPELIVKRLVERSDGPCTEPVQRHPDDVQVINRVDRFRHRIGEEVLGINLHRCGRRWGGSILNWPSFTL